MEFAALHQVPEFQKECAEVLNEEWKRSLAARLHSLEKSRDSFPVCLVLLEQDKDGQQHVVGHSMLSVVRGQAMQSCLVESVVVRKSHRGKGYGRIVMQKTEEFAARKGYEVMYLTTHDKQKFYEHLGYEYCSPIVTCSSDILPEKLANKLMGNLAIKSTGDNNRQDSENTKKQSLAVLDYSENNSKNLDNIKNAQSRNIENATTGKKSLKEGASPLAPPPPVAPPPPMAPPPPTSVPDKAGDKQVTRWDPSCVSWMKKRIV